MNVLIICNTYSQLLVAIQLKKTMMKDEYVAVVLSNHSNGAARVYDQLKESCFFEDIILVDSKSLDLSKHGIKDSLYCIGEMVIGNSHLFDRLHEKKYDKLLYYNLSVSTMICYAVLYKYNKRILCERIEEGILSYGELEKELIIPNSRGKIAYWLRRMLLKNNFTSQTKCVYCYYPEYYKGALRTIRIPPIDTDDLELKRILAQIFEYEQSEYRQKYIYFSSVYDFEGDEPIGELELIKKISNKVGKENLIIKVHPRDSVERFAGLGCSVDDNSRIPWEIIQINNDFSGHVFITYNSSCVLTMNLCVDKPVSTIFVFDICKTTANKKAKESVDYIKNVLERIGSENTKWIKIIKDIMEI